MAGKLDELMARARTESADGTTDGTANTAEEPRSIGRRSARRPAETTAAETETTMGRQTTDARPIVLAVERLQRTVLDELEGLRDLKEFKQEQDDYLKEMTRAHSEMTSDWYRIAALLPQIDLDLKEIAAKARTLKTEMAADQHAVRGLVRQQRRLILIATGVVVAVCVLAVLALLVIVGLAAAGHGPT